MFQQRVEGRHEAHFQEQEEENQHRQQGKESREHRRAEQQAQPSRVRRAERSWWAAPARRVWVLWRLRPACEEKPVLTLWARLVSLRGKTGLCFQPPVQDTAPFGAEGDEERRAGRSSYRELCSGKNRRTDHQPDTGAPVKQQQHQSEQRDTVGHRHLIQETLATKSQSSLCVFFRTISSFSF